MCRQVSGVDIHGTDGVCNQEAGAQDEEKFECKDCRVSKRIPTEKIATALMSVGFPAPRLCAIETENPDHDSVYDSLRWL